MEELFKLLGQKNCSKSIMSRFDGKFQQMMDKITYEI